jgi:hypothetical protein
MRLVCSSCFKSDLNGAISRQVWRTIVQTGNKEDIMNAAVTLDEVISMKALRENLGDAACRPNGLFKAKMHERQQKTKTGIHVPCNCLTNNDI